MRNFIKNHRLVIVFGGFWGFFSMLPYITLGPEPEYSFIIKFITLPAVLFFYLERTIPGLERFLLDLEAEFGAIVGFGLGFGMPILLGIFIVLFVSYVVKAVGKSALVM